MKIGDNVRLAHGITRTANATGEVVNNGVVARITPPEAEVAGEMNYPYPRIYVEFSDGEWDEIPREQLVYADA